MIERRRIRCLWLIVCTLLPAACRDTPGRPAALPSPTPTAGWGEEECRCPCVAWKQVNAWLDADRDGWRGSGDQPLAGVTVRAEWASLPCETGGQSQKQVSTAVTDDQGHAEIRVTGCNCEDGVQVYAEAPAGYKLTTPDLCLREQCSFSLALQ